MLWCSHFSLVALLQAHRHERHGQDVPLVPPLAKAWGSQSLLGGGAPPRARLPLGHHTQRRDGALVAAQVFMEGHPPRPAC